MSELPSGWASVKFDDVVDVLDFEREPVNATEREMRNVGKRSTELYPYYGATGQVGVIDGFRSQGDRVLLGEDGAPFLDPKKTKAFFVSGKFWVNNHAHVLSGTPGLMGNRFLCHQLNTVDYHEHVTGTTRLKLTRAAMQQIKLVLPPFAEQTRIVEKLEELLSGLDAGVAELKSAQQKLARYRQSLLKAAVQGELTAAWRARHPLKETGAQLLARILTERRTRWEARQLAKFAQQGKIPPKDWQKKYPEPAQPDTADLPALPQGWVWATVDQLSHFVRNGISKTPNTDGVGFPILRINAVRSMSVSFEKTKNIELLDTEALDYFVEDGDLLATRYNGSVDLLGVFGLVRNPPAKVLHPDKLIRMKPVVEGALGSWMEIAANTGSSRAHIVQRVKTTAGQTGISGEDVRKMPVPLPPLTEQQSIVQTLQEQLAAVLEQACVIERALQQSTAQRQNLLRAAFSGQLLPQNPADEPASALLARIRAERAAQGTARKPRGRKVGEAA